MRFLLLQHFHFEGLRLKLERSQTSGSHEIHFCKYFEEISHFGSLIFSAIVVGLLFSIQHQPPFYHAIGLFARCRFAERTRA